MADRRQALRHGWPAQYMGTVTQYRQFRNIVTLNRARSIQYVLPRTENNSNAYSGEFIFTFRVRSNVRGPQSLAQLTNPGLTRIFMELRQLVRMWKGLSPNDWIQFTFSDGSQRFSTLFTRYDTLTPAAITRRLVHALQSNTTFRISQLRIIVTYGIQRRMGCRFKTYDILKKQCIIKIRDAGDKMCFFRALAVGLELDADYFGVGRKMLSGVKRYEFRDRYARQLLEKANTRATDGVSVEDIAYYERCFNARIMVLDIHTLDIVRKPSRVGVYRIALLQDTQHFHVVRWDKLGRLWNKPNFCKRCLLPFTKICQACKDSCVVCKDPHCAALRVEDLEIRRQLTDANGIVCEYCELVAFDKYCLEKHTARICKSVQELFRRCKKCGEKYHKSRRHRCQKKQTFVTAPPKRKKKKKVTTAPYAFYDFECTLDDGVHNPALIVVYDEPRDTVLSFPDVDAFLDTILKRDYEGYTFIAHNAAKYDFHFIKKTLIKRKVKSDDLGGGRGIIYSCIPKLRIRFIDSYRFLPFSLRRFPKTFGFSDVVKGHFPYTFYTQENRNYCGPMPDMKHFGFERLTGQDREHAVQWYTEHAHDTIDLEAMCKEYCIDDVKVLAKGCRIFRELILEKTDGDVDPFQCVTIAGVALECYMKFTMPEKSIAVIPPRNIHLQYQEECRQFYDQEVLYMPCYETGCPHCFTDQSVHIETGILMATVRNRWIASHKDDPRLAVRECEWQMKRERDIDVKAFLKTYIDESPYCHPRDSFFGGRTECFILYRKCRENEKIRYLDFTSLYPSVQFGKLRGVTRDTYDTFNELPYPVGVHELIEPDDTDIEPYFGFIKCRVRSPDFILYPVLPVRREGKLLFPLGVLTGTWCTVELRNAVKHGYVIERIFQVWHYPESSTTLFRGYVQSFLKMKQQAVGWSKLGIHDEGERQRYIEDYKTHMGIDLEMSEDHNPGMYGTSKLMLNSLWGKFAQRLNYVNTVDTLSYEDFAKYAYNDRHVVKNVTLHDSIVRTVSYELRNDCVRPSNRTNVAIASFTTAYARTRLYEVMQHLEGRLIYCDTDSVIFVDDGSVDLVTGDYLGDLTDELGHGDFITEIVATAPKSYAYRTAQGKTEVKMKGFTLDGMASQIIHFDTMKEVLDDNTKVLKTQPLLFDVDEHHNIRTRQWSEDEGKTYSFTFNKRQRTDNYETKPFII